MSNKKVAVSLNRKTLIGFAPKYGIQLQQKVKKIYA
jgi:hypothetical protein